MAPLPRRSNPRIAGCSQSTNSPPDAHGRGLIERATSPVRKGKLGASGHVEWAAEVGARAARASEVAASGQNWCQPSAQAGEIWGETQSPARPARPRSAPGSIALEPPPQPPPPWPRPAEGPFRKVDRASILSFSSVSSHSRLRGLFYFRRSFSFANSTTNLSSRQPHFLVAFPASLPPPRGRPPRPLLVRASRPPPPLSAEPFTLLHSILRCF